VLLAHLKATGDTSRDIEGAVEHAASRAERASKNPNAGRAAKGDGG